MILHSSWMYVSASAARCKRRTRCLRELPAVDLRVRPRLALLREACGAVVDACSCRGGFVGSPVEPCGRYITHESCHTTRHQAIHAAGNRALRHRDYTHVRTHTGRLHKQNAFEIWRKNIAHHGRWSMLRLLPHKKRNIRKTGKEGHMTRVNASVSIHIVWSEVRSAPVLTSMRASPAVSMSASISWVFLPEWATPRVFSLCGKPASFSACASRGSSLLISPCKTSPHTQVLVSVIDSGDVDRFPLLLPCNGVVCESLRVESCAQ